MRSLLVSFLFILLTCATVFAVEVKIGDISSDYDDNKTKFFLELKDDGSIDSVRFLQTAPNGQINQDNTFTYEQVVDGGVVIYWNGSYEVVRLEVKDFSPITGGTAILNYLYNGLTGSRRYISLNLGKGPQGFYLAYYGNLVNTFFIHANRSPLGVILGIRSINPSLN